MKDAILIRRGRLVDPKNGLNGTRDLLIRDGKIAEISEKALSYSGAEIIEAQGRYLFPGFIDLHVHLREPGEEGKETVLTGCQAAVAGGFTGIVSMPNTRPVNDTPFITRFILLRAQEANLCRVFPAGAISKGLAGAELAEMGELVNAGCVCVTDDGQPVMSASLMRRALLYAKTFDIPVMAHEEDLTLSGPGVASEGPVADRLGLAMAPKSAEVVMIARDLVLAEETGSRLHVAHLSCAGSVRLIREAKRRGVAVTCEAAPHHFTLTDQALGGYDTNAKMKPPLRQQSDVDAIREGLADGTIDAIATDHAPHGVLDKHVEFDRAANGIVGLETALPLALEGVKAGWLKLERMVELLTHGPARAFALGGGHLGVGTPADLAIVDLEAQWKVDAEKFFSKSRNTPFNGRSVRGRVVRTLVAGRTVYGAASRES
jgi:dihydroorotase